jgi:DNA-directed RNA polymerase subunit K/omega
MVSSSIITRDVVSLSQETGNIYEAVVIMSKRSRQLSLKIKDELNSKLSEFASSVDNLEEVFENREQIEISKYYERLPKSPILAIEEFLEGKIMYRRVDKTL